MGLAESIANKPTERGASFLKNEVRKLLLLSREFYRIVLGDLAHIF